MTVLNINGVEHVWPDDAAISYEEVVKLAGHSGNPTVVYSQRKDQWQRKGQLHTGTLLGCPLDGTRFTVCHTGNA